MTKIMIVIDQNNKFIPLSSLFHLIHSTSYFSPKRTTIEIFPWGIFKNCIEILSRISIEICWCLPPTTTTTICTFTCLL